MHNNMERGLNREIMRDNGGTGNHWDNPPNHFEVQIEDQNERKKLFAKFARGETKLCSKYKDWLNQECNLFTSGGRSTQR